MDQEQNGPGPKHGSRAKREYESCFPLVERLAAEMNRALREEPRSADLILSAAEIFYLQVIEDMAEQLTATVPPPDRNARQSDLWERAGMRFQEMVAMKRRMLEGEE